MRRRTFLGALGALGVGATGLVTGAQGATAAGTARSPFTRLTGWPTAARVELGGTTGGARPVTLALGHRLGIDGYGAAVARRLAGDAWSGAVPVSVPVVWGATTPASAGGLWLHGTRAEVTLPGHDGSAVVGRLEAGGAWHPLDTSGLPRFLQTGSLREVGGALLLTGGVPTGDGRAVLPFAARWSLVGGWSGWRRDAIAPDPAGVRDLGGIGMRLADGSSGVAVFGDRLLERSGGRWRDRPGPTTDGTPTTMVGAALLPSGLVVAGPGALGDDEVRRRTAGGWERLTVPAGLLVNGVVGRGDEAWVLGAVLDGHFRATAVRVSAGGVLRDDVRQAEPGTVFAGGFVAADGSLVGHGSKEVPLDGDSVGWTVRVAS
ncbi:hypothetical protein [Lapillicoccus jejuensis]|uniref:Uncharacterized protein n=1 Tax=Lapillicoccus jejuensis TaxID=402171 RepID=A0A542DXY5_9MICO|nr:hypothetical protein [Lapillicoccus jejuensis]TQJ07951.1 hypothetical protein FB458_1023 [Lapillicoccus jejuensis]